MPATQRMRSIFATAATLFSISAVPAKAEMSAREWLASYQLGNGESRRLIEEITRATVNGMGWYAARSKVQLYCEPPKMAFTGSQLLDILQRSVDQSARIASAP